MFDKLKGMFGSKDAPAQAPAAPAASKAKKRPKVSLDKRFTLVAETGQGSMSKVFRAVENETGRVVCLKLQDAEKTQAALARSQSGRPSEGEVGMEIVHPNVVRTFDFGQTTKGEYFVVMEFIEGVSLTYVRQSRPFNLKERLRLLAQAAEGLAAVHGAGFIHRDFGPKNLLVDRDGRVRLIDFGLAVPNTPAFQRPGNRTGTLLYMAPELVRREPTDQRIDIFSFGVTAFEFLTNKFPYDATDPMGMIRQRMNLEPMDIAKAQPRLPKEVCAVINKALAKDRDQRWSRMAMVAHELRVLLGEEEPEGEDEELMTF